jgi:hypothetical protein
MDDSAEFVIDRDDETGRSAPAERTGWEDVVFELEDVALLVL